MSVVVPVADASATGQSSQETPRHEAHAELMDDIKEWSVSGSLPRLQLEPVEQARSLTHGERVWSLVVVLLWGLGLFLCSPIWMVIILLRQVGLRVARGLGARLLHTEEYAELHFSVYNCCTKMGSRWRFIPPAMFLGLDLLLTDPVRKCWTDALNVIIIVSGLLTTSSYQAMFVSFDSTENTIFSSAQLERLADIQLAFRLANTVAFLASLATIVTSAMIVLNLQMLATWSHAERRVLTKWSQALMYLGYRLSMYSFFTSLAAIVLAVGLAAYGLFADPSDKLVVFVAAWVFLLVILMLISAGLLVTTVQSEPVPDIHKVRELLAEQAGAAADPSASAASHLDAVPIRAAASAAAASNPPEIQVMEASSSKGPPLCLPLMSADTGDLVTERDQSSHDLAHLQLQLLQQLVQAQQEQLQAQQESVGVMKQLRSVLHGEDAHRRIVRARGGRSKLLWKPKKQLPRQVMPDPRQQAAPRQAESNNQPGEGGPCDSQEAALPDQIPSPEPQPTSTTVVVQPALSTT